MNRKQKIRKFLKSGTFLFILWFIAFLAIMAIFGRSMYLMYHVLNLIY